MRLSKRFQFRSLFVLGALVVISFILNFLSKKNLSVASGEERISLIPEAKADDGGIGITACCTSSCTG